MEIEVTLFELIYFKVILVKDIFMKGNHFKVTALLVSLKLLFSK